MNVEPKLIAWICGIVFIAGGMVYTLQSVAGDVETLAHSLNDHVLADGHTARGVRVDYIEERQREIASSVERLEVSQAKIIRSQAAICAKIGADCK